MIFIFALLLLSIVNSKVLSVKDTKVVPTSRGGLYFESNQNIYKIKETNGFKIVPGRASITYEIDETAKSPSVKILEYKKLEEIKVKENNLRQAYKIPRTFDKVVNASFLRYNFKSAPCMSIPVVKNQLHYLNMALKLMSGYRTQYDEINSYITPNCLTIADTCWVNEDVSAGCAYTEAKRLDPSLVGRKFATTVHLFEKHFSWGGLAHTLDEMTWLQGHNWYAWVQHDANPGPLDGFSVMIHEVGHSMGMKHAARAPDGTGFMRKYQKRDAYNDYSNYMGWGSNWYNIPGPGQWMRENNQNSVFPPWVRQCENGVHKYRLFAWDYAYTRVFLGDEKRIPHQESDILDGIQFKYNTAGIIVEYGNNTFNTALSPLKRGSIVLEYHWFNGGLESYKNKGIKFTIGDYDTGSDTVGFFSAYLNGAVDDNIDYSGSEIPLNYLKVPEVNIGTMKFRITKFHPIKDTSSNPELLAEFPSKTITLDDVPYLEIEITHLPNIPYTPPTAEAPVPEMIFSQALSNCYYNLGPRAYYCQYFNENNYWTFVKPGPSTNNTLPRFYVYNSNFQLTNIPDGRLGVVSYQGAIIGLHAVMSGTMDIENVRTTKMSILINEVEPIVSEYTQNCIVFSYDFVTQQKIIYQHPDLISDKYDALFVKNTIKNYQSFYLTDFYNNNYSIAMTNISATNGGIIFFKPLQVQGFTKYFLKMVDANGKIANQVTITRQQKKLVNRVAVYNYNATEDTVMVEVATLKGKKTTPIVAGPIEFLQDTWYFFVYNKFLLSEYIYIDFEGEIPEGLFVEIMTEIGVFTKDLSYMAMFPGQTAKIIVLEISQSTGGWGEVYQFKFNKNVNLSGMRHVLQSGSSIRQPGGVNPVVDKYFTLVSNRERYHFTCDGVLADYEFQPFTVTLLDQKLTFNSELNQFKINIPTQFSLKYQTKEIYNVLTEEILLVPTINPSIGTYSYTMKTEIEGLSINESTGVITGYINNNLHKTIEVVAEGERSITYTFDLNIEYPKCAENGSIKEGDYNEIQKVDCTEEDLAGQIEYKCIIENHKSIWEKQSDDCSNRLKYPTQFKYLLSESYMVLTQLIDATPIVEPGVDKFNYSFVINNIPNGLLINENGVISGYIEDDSISEINITIIGEKEIVFEKKIELNYPKCEAKDLLKEGEYDEVQIVACSGADLRGNITYRCTVENHKSIWKKQNTTCSGKLPTRFEYTIEQSYLVLTQSIRLIPIIEPDVYSYEYSFIKNTLPTGLSMDSEGIISGYIEDDSIKEINIKAVGEREATFSFTIEINYPKCLSTDIFEESDYSTEIEVSCNDDEYVGLYKYKCSIDAVNHVSVWERFNHTCRAKYVHSVSYTNYTGVQGENIALKPVISNPNEDNIEFYSSDLPFGLLLDKNTGVISGSTLFIVTAEVIITSKGERFYSTVANIVINKNDDLENKYCNEEIKYGSIIYMKCGIDKIGILKNECSNKGEYNISKEKCLSIDSDIEEMNINLKLKPNKTLNEVDFNRIYEELAKIFRLNQNTTIKLKDNIIYVNIVIDSEEYKNISDPIIKIEYISEISDVQLYCYESDYEVKIKVETPKKDGGTKMETNTFIGIVAGSVGAIIVLCLILVISLKCRSKQNESRMMKNKSKLEIVNIEENENAAVLEVPGNEKKPVLERSAKLPNNHKEAIKSNIGNTPQNTKLNRRNKQLNSSAVINSTRGVGSGSKRISQRKTSQPINNQNSGTNSTTLMSATSAMINQKVVINNNSLRKNSGPIIKINNPQLNSSSIVKNQTIVGEKIGAKSNSLRKSSNTFDLSPKKAI